MADLRNLTVLAVSIALLMGFCAPASAQSFDELLTQAATYKLGQSRKPLEAIQNQVIKDATDPAKRAHMAGKLAALLAKPDATFECKDFVCRQLHIIATPAEVPPLAALLTNDQLSHMGRYVLERMEDPAAGAALRNALQNTKGKLLIGVVNSIGNRRDPLAVPVLKTMLAEQDLPLACAAAAALGKIGGDEAMAALTHAKSSATGDFNDAVMDAIIRSADELLTTGKRSQAAEIYANLLLNQPPRIRMAALRGMAEADPAKTTPVLLAMLKSNQPTDQAVAAGYLARQMPGQDITSAFAAALNALAPDAQVLLIDSLAIRGDVAARPAVLAAATSDNEAVRASAMRAIGFLGNADDVAILATTAANGGNVKGVARKLSQVKNGSHKILLIEELTPNDGICWIYPYDADDTPTFRHNGKGSFGFADGHVESLEPTELGFAVAKNLVTPPALINDQKARSYFWLTDK